MDENATPEGKTSRSDAKRRVRSVERASGTPDGASARRTSPPEERLRLPAHLPLKSLAGPLSSRTIFDRASIFGFTKKNR
jgi:hypothetical protein